jgi:hypothetical protein
MPQAITRLPGSHKQDGGSHTSRQTERKHASSLGVYPKAGSTLCRGATLSSISNGFQRRDRLAFAFASQHTASLYKLDSRRHGSTRTSRSTNIRYSSLPSAASELDDLTNTQLLRCLTLPRETPTDPPTQWRSRNNRSVNGCREALPQSWETDLLSAHHAKLQD